MALLAGGMAVDGEGNVWVGDLENLRVQKFSPNGDFLLMLGGDVNKTKAEDGAPAGERNVCPVDPGDVCQAGTSGEGPGQLFDTISDILSYSPAANALLVGDTNGIQVFELDGTHRETIFFTGALSALTGRSVNALDVGKDGNIYFSLSDLEDVYKLSLGGEPLAPGKPGESSFEVGNPLGVAVDVDGNVYVIDDPPLLAPNLESRVLIFDAVGNKFVPTKSEEEAEQFFPYVPSLGPDLTDLATNLCAGSEAPGSLYLSFYVEIFPPPQSYVNAYGTAPISCELPPSRPPEILEQFVSSVGREEATVKATINPRFWPDATYYVEYGAGKCSEGGCGFNAPASPAQLIDKSLNGAVTTTGVVLDGLEPGTTYHYRFVAQSSGGGPVFGVDPDGRAGPVQPSAEEGLEATVRTFRTVGEPTACANDATRGGSSAPLPDCRAFEMVSPLDKGGGDVALWEGKHGISPSAFETHQAALSGERFTFTSLLAFGDAESGPFVSQHTAKRTGASWTSESISPPRTESPLPATFNFDDEFQAFTDDLCSAWVRPYSIAPLTDDAIEGYPNIYRRENCSDSAIYEAITTEKPSNRGPEQSGGLTVKGFSKGGSKVVFVSGGKLLPDAPDANGGELLLYEHTPEGLRFVCYLPNGKPSSQACSAGNSVENALTDFSSLHNAVSDDGSRIFWTAYSGTAQVQSRPGQIYVRIDGKETRKVSTNVTLEPTIFWTAANDGSKAVFEVVAGPLKDNLYELDVDSGTPTLIAKGVEGPMGASEDASRIYFASSEDLDAAGPASVGDHNLYLYEAAPAGGGEGFSFIAKVPAADIGHPILLTGPATKPVDFSPAMRSARVSPDGLHVAFMSVVSPAPTGYDNRDADTGTALAEVYLYDAVEDELRCVSCSPSGARPTGSEGLAARIQGWEERLHAPRVLSDDGTRVFFESFEALVPRDTNGTWDVYQWEEAGKGTCTTASETYSDASGGCVDLISAGTSPAKSTFLDADPSGDNVFFSTQSSLVGQDYGLNDVYVARVGGGFPEPAERSPCGGEACRSPAPPPPEVTPSTETSSGPGNAIKPKPRRCPKGKRKVRRAGKIRCVKRKAKAGHRRRAVR